MEIKASLVKELRDRIGAGMMECKKALVESDGDLEKAVDILRKKGITKAEKLAGREASQGLVDSYIHVGGKIGVLIEVNCETDFVARTDDFQALTRDLAMQVAAANPIAVTREAIDSRIVDHEKEIYRAQVLESGKPEKVLEKIVSGKLDKFYQENCLMEQAFIKNPDISVQQMLDEYKAKLGENILVKRFSRFQLGGD